MGRCVTPAGKGVRKVHKKKCWLVLLLAGLALLVLTGCTQPKQVDSRNMPTTAQLIVDITPDLDVGANDTLLDRGTAAAANYMIKNRYNPGAGEEKGAMLTEALLEMDAEKYNQYSAPQSDGAQVYMARLFVYSGTQRDVDIATEISSRIRQMDRELYKEKEILNSRYTYTYRYSVSVRQVYSDRNTAWVIGVGVTQTAKEEHKT